MNNNYDKILGNIVTIVYLRSIFFKYAQVTQFKNKSNFENFIKIDLSILLP